MAVAVEVAGSDLGPARSRIGGHDPAADHIGPAHVPDRGLTVGVLPQDVGGISAGVEASRGDDVPPCPGGARIHGVGAVVLSDPRLDLVEHGGRYLDKVARSVGADARDEAHDLRAGGGLDPDRAAAGAGANRGSLEKRIVGVDGDGLGRGDLSAIGRGRISGYIDRPAGEIGLNSHRSDAVERRGKMDDRVVGLRLLAADEVVGVVDLEIVNGGAGSRAIGSDAAVIGRRNRDVRGAPHALAVDDMTGRQHFIRRNQDAGTLP